MIHASDVGIRNQHRLAIHRVRVLNGETLTTHFKINYYFHGSCNVLWLSKQMFLLTKIIKFDHFGFGS